jgi:nicotinamide-nucleotide amidase
MKNETTLSLLSQQVGSRLKAKALKLSCAESCTGGLVAKALTDIAGSSAWFEFGFVTYSNQAKQTLLSVSSHSLEQHGAVSEQVVREMALGALRVSQADIALSVSGIAGPDGGSEQKPVGTVWFGFADKQGNTLAYKQLFSGDREQVRLQSAVFALETVYQQFLVN